MEKERKLNQTHFPTSVPEAVLLLRSNPLLFTKIRREDPEHEGIYDAALTEVSEMNADFMRLQAYYMGIRKD